jgi:uncharacterized membrane protein
LAGATLLGPAAILPAAFGSALADLLGGYSVYIIPTFLVKGLMAAFAGIAIARNKSGMTGTAVIFIIAEILMIFGYFVTENFLYGFSLALAAIPANIFQGLSGVLIGILLYKYMQNLKKELNK